MLLEENHICLFGKDYSKDYFITDIVQLTSVVFLELCVDAFAVFCPSDA
jgi:hypothetical protein